MKIVLFGATGNPGRQIAKEALDRGHHVVGVAHEPSRVISPDARLTLVQGNATDVRDVARVARGADAVVSAISPLSSAALAVTAGAREAGVERVILVPGAGSLDVARLRLLDARSFPDAHKNAEETTEALLALLVAGTGFEWTVPGRRDRQRRAH